MYMYLICIWSRIRSYHNIVLWQSHYTKDYTSVGSVLSFQEVFAIMFNGCTGIMGRYICVYIRVLYIAWSWMHCITELSGRVINSLIHSVKDQLRGFGSLDKTQDLL